MSSIPARIPIGAQRASQIADRDPVRRTSSTRAEASAFGSMLAHRIANQRAASPDTPASAQESNDATREENVGVDTLDRHAETSLAMDARLLRDRDATTDDTGESLPRAATDSDVQMTAEAAGTGESAGMETTSEPAAPGASEEAAPINSLPPNVPYRGLDGVVPELREKLQRVMDRMREEHGVEVSVVETYRPQARQDALHAQGRSTPGQVVTWTRNSRHTQGRAVDVMVNGGYTDSRAFATLQQVARDEGLHTLGMRDPGHLELPADVAAGTRSGRTAVDLSALTRLASEAGARVDEMDIAPNRQEVAHITHTGQVARPARVAQVAAVASVATVATVARVATVGAQPTARAAVSSQASGDRVDASRARGGYATDAMSGSTSPNIAATGTTVASNAAAGMGGQGFSGDSTTGQHGYRRRQGGDDATGTTPTSVTRDYGDNTLALGNDAGRDPGAQQAPTRAAAVTGSNAADSIARMDRIDMLRDGSAARPLSQLTLSLDNATGGTDRIRVGLRGSQVDAVLELSDSAMHDRVTSRLGELQGALEQRGLETDSLRVRRAGATATDGLELTRIASAAVERGNARGAAQNGSNPGGDQQQPGQYTPQRGRDERAHRDTAAHDHKDRHNPRREPKENQR